MADWNCEAFEAEDIVKYGYMMIKRPPTSTKVRIKVCCIKIYKIYLLIIFMTIDIFQNTPQNHIHTCLIILYFCGCKYIAIYFHIQHQTMLGMYLCN